MDGYLQLSFFRHPRCGRQTRRVAGQVLQAPGDGLGIQLRLYGPQQPFLLQLHCE